MQKYGDISQRTATFAVKRLLRIGLPQLITQRFAQIETQKTNSTKSRTWRRYLALAVSTAPLAEGVTPASQKLEHEDVTAVLKQYGRTMDLTDQVADLHEDPQLMIMSERMGEQFAQTIEMLTIEKLCAGTNAFFANGNVRGDINYVMNRGLLRKVVRAFRRNKATEITRVISASTKVSTAGVESGYFAMCHTDLDPDIRDMTGFKSVIEYGQTGVVMEGEIGAVERIRFILTTMWEPYADAGAAKTNGDGDEMTSTSGTLADVYPVIIVARDAYACVRLQGRNVLDLMVLNPNTPRGGDPMGQRGYVSWKTYYACAILNELWMTRIETASIANPS